MNEELSYSFSATDEQLMFTEEAYCQLEAEHERKRTEQIHQLSALGIPTKTDPIGHDPYVLASLLSAICPDFWSLEQMDSVLQMIFALQYTVETEAIPEGDKRAVYFRNKDCAHIPYFLKNCEISIRYAGFLKSLGNRPNLFLQSETREKLYLHPPLEYSVSDALRSKKPFSLIISEAEKYLGFPYVWGGSEPATSFDCSGFVCYVLNHCGAGWNIGRVNSKTLFTLCIQKPESEATPGDLIFFTRSAGSPEVTHVGIFVGDGMMIHAGNPIQYTRFTEGFFSDKFLCFGRPTLERLK